MFNIKKALLASAIIIGLVGFSGAAVAASVNYQGEMIAEGQGPEDIPSEEELQETFKQFEEAVSKSQEQAKEGFFSFIKGAIFSLIKWLLIGLIGLAIVIGLIIWLIKRGGKEKKEDKQQGPPQQGPQQGPSQGPSQGPQPGQGSQS